MKIVKKNWQGKDTGRVQLNGERDQEVKELYEHLINELLKCGYEQGQLEDLDDHVNKLAGLLASLVVLLLEKKLISFSEMNALIRVTGIPPVVLYEGS